MRLMQAADRLDEEVVAGQVAVRLSWPKPVIEQYDEPGFPGARSA